MNAEWIRHLDSASQGRLVHAITANVLKASGYRAASMRDTTSADDETVLFHANFKSAPVHYRVKNQDRHGIDMTAWNEIRKVADTHHGPVCIVIFEVFANEFKADWSGALLMQSVARLGSPEHGRNERVVKSYWPRKAFVEVHRFTPESARECANNIDAPDLSAKLQTVLTPQRQSAMF